MDTNSFTPEELAAWRRGELIIEFQFDEPPQVNQQDFEKWVQERKWKPPLIWHDSGLELVDTEIKEIPNAIPRCIK